MSSHFPLDTLHYENFDLRIHEPINGQYRIEVIDSPVGEMTRPLSKSFRHRRSLPFLSDLASLGRSNLRLRDAKKLGSQLGHMLFPDEVWNMFYASLSKQRAREEGLRIRLRIDAPELSRLPWEYCYREPFGYLALSRKTPFVRYINQPLAADSLASALPLRLLVVIANPLNLAPLDVEAEKKRITEALQGQETQIQAHFLQEATATRLQDALNQYRPHILHFIGHGLVDGQMGKLALENHAHKAHLVDAEQFMTLLQGRGIKIVVLNACQTADYAEDDRAIMGVAPALVRANIPAVIAMQFPVPDSTAILFTRQLYTSLAQGQTLDTAITEMRINAYVNGNDNTYWGIPTLFMRSQDGIIRQPSQPAADATQEAPQAGEPEQERERAQKQEQKQKPAGSTAVNISEISSGGNISISFGDHGSIVGGNISN